MLKPILDAVKMQLHRLTLTPAYPVFGNFIVTWRCNYRCVMCNNWKRPFENELTPQEINQLLLKNRWLQNLEIVSITGGEPFMRRDLEDIVKVFQNHKIPVIGITTNASMPERIRDLLEHTAKDSDTKFWLHISLDGSPETHNKIRGFPYAFDNVVETVRLAKALKLENVTLAVGMCISKINVNEIIFVRTFAELHNLRLVVGLAEQGWIFGHKGVGDNLYEFNDEEKSVICIEMEKIGTWYAKGVIQRLNGMNSLLPCTAFWHGFTIAPNGDMHPCVNSPFIVGNIRQMSFDDIWTSDRAKHARKLVKICDGCWSNCEMNYTRRYSALPLFQQFWKVKLPVGGINVEV